MRKRMKIADVCWEPAVSTLPIKPAKIGPVRIDRKRLDFCRSKGPMSSPKD
jgi:hypothetical protein